MIAEPSESELKKELERSNGSAFGRGPEAWWMKPAPATPSNVIKGQNQISDPAGRQGKSRLKKTKARAWDVEQSTARRVRCKLPLDNLKKRRGIPELSKGADKYDLVIRGVIKIQSWNQLVLIYLTLLLKVMAMNFNAFSSWGRALEMKNACRRTEPNSCFLYAAHWQVARFHTCTPWP